MARWLDLPTELRTEILSYVFVNTVTTYSPPPLYDGPSQVCHSQSQGLFLMLVAKSFAHNQDIVNTMMRETTLSIRSDRDIYKIGHDLKYDVKPLYRLRSLELAAPFHIELDTSLRQFRCALPNLRDIRVRISELSFPSLWYCPEIVIPGGGFCGDSPNYDSPEQQIRHGPCTINIDRFSATYHDSRDLTEFADEETGLPPEPQHGPIYSSESALAVSEALIVVPEGGRGDFSARWLASLLTDAVTGEFGIQIVLLWASEVRVADPSPGRDVVFTVRPTFFSTKDMCLRFLDEDNEGIIPQTFPDSLQAFAHGGTYDASWM